MLESFVIVYTLTFYSGDTLVAYGDVYTSYDVCMVQGEADSKRIDRSLARAERELKRPIIKTIRVSCESSPLSLSEGTKYGK